MALRNARGEKSLDHGRRHTSCPRHKIGNISTTGVAGVEETLPFVYPDTTSAWHEIPINTSPFPRSMLYAPPSCLASEVPVSEDKRTFLPTFERAIIGQ